MDPSMVGVSVFLFVFITTLTLLIFRSRKIENYTKLFKDKENSQTKIFFQIAFEKDTRIFLR